MTKTNIDSIIEARHRWLEAIIDKEGHALISAKWEVFVSLVKTSSYSMYEFEEMLKKTNPTEYEFAFKAGATR